MTFILPAANNSHNADPDVNTRFLARIGTLITVQTKPAGNLPITNTAGQFRNNQAQNVFGGLSYEFQASQASWDVSTDTKVLLWHNQFNAPNRIQVATVASGGCRIRIYSGTGSPPANYREFYVGGRDTPQAECIKGQFPLIIDLNDATHNVLNGTFDNTAVTSYAYGSELDDMAGTADNWNYMASCFVVDTTKTSASTPTFSGSGSTPQDAVTLIQGTDFTDKIGNWVRKIGDVIFIDMAFRIGNNSSVTTFNDSGSTIVSPIANDPADPSKRFTTQAMRTYLNLRNNAADTALFTGTWIWGSRAAFDWDQDDAAIVTFTSPTFIGMGRFTLGSSITGSATFDNVDAVIFADPGVDIDGSLFKNQNGNHALEMTVGAMDIASMRFESYAAKHAILIDTAGTYNLTDVVFDQSGTNDIETTHASGVVAIVTKGTAGTLLGTGDVTVTGAGTITVANERILSITVTDTDGVPIQNARVEVSATETVGTVTSGDVLLTGLTNAFGLLQDTAFNYETAFNPSGLDIEIKARQGTTAPFKKNALVAGTITSGGFSITIALISDE